MSRDWAVLIYFAADNDLEGAALLNLYDILRLASNDRVHILAQFDGRSQKAMRFFMGGPGNVVQSELPTDPNTGSAEALIDFVRWANSEEHRAENYLIVIWGHGTGIDDDEDDRGAAALRRALGERLEGGGISALGAVAPAGATAKALEPPSLTFAGPSVDSFTSVGEDLATDLAQGGPDALTCVELRHAFEVIEKEVLGKKIAIFGMDACLMGMAEIAQQVSDSVELMVASEEVIPDKSWPYKDILPELLNRPEMTPEQLSELIVKRYVAHYERDPMPVTLSACRLSKTGELAEALAELGRRLGALVAAGELRKAITRARRETQVFRFRDYIDLHHFCKVFQETLGSPRFAPARARAEAACRAAEDACRRVMRVIEGENGPDSGFVLCALNTSKAGGALENARGVSIYFPPLPPTYADLVLSDRARWDTFLHAYMNAAFRPHALRGAGEARGASGGNGRDPKMEGANVTMSTEATPQPRLLLPKGTTVRDEAEGFEETLTSFAFLLLNETDKIKVPKDTELDIPAKGKVKASSGTPTKATSGTRIDQLASVELVLPACILSMPLASGEDKKLSDGTTVRTAGQGGDPFVVLDSVDFEGLP